jgi:hypothetical protein
LFNNDLKGYIMKAWTDYPFTGLGDIPGYDAPVRQIEVFLYDGDKYCTVKVYDLEHEAEIKRCYIYQKSGRLGEVPAVTEKQLLNLN